MFYTLMSLLEGHSFEEAKEKVAVGELSRLGGVNFVSLN